MIRRTKTKLKLKWLGPELNNNYNYNELLNENLSDYNRQVQAETHKNHLMRACRKNGGGRCFSGDKIGTAIKSHNSAEVYEVDMLSDPKYLWGKVRQPEASICFKHWGGSNIFERRSGVSPLEKFCIICFAVGEF